MSSQAHRADVGGEATARPEPPPAPATAAGTSLPPGRRRPAWTGSPVWLCWYSAQRMEVLSVFTYMLHFQQPNYKTSTRMKTKKRKVGPVNRPTEGRWPLALPRRPRATLNSCGQAHLPGRASGAHRGTRRCRP